MNETGFPVSRVAGGHSALRHAQTRQDEFICVPGDRTPGDEVAHPDDDLRAVLVEGAWRVAHEDATPY